METAKFLSMLQAAKYGLAGALLSLAALGTAAAILQEPFPEMLHIICAVSVGAVATIAKAKRFIP